MGIDYCAAIFVGLPRAELNDIEMLEDWLDADELQVCPPHYDGNSEDYAIVGYQLYSSGTYSPSELVYDSEEVETMKREFKDLTGLDAKIWISTYGY